MKKTIISLSLLIFTLVFTNCKKDEDKELEPTTPTPVNTVQETGTVELIFEPVLDGTPYNLNTSFTTPAGENLTITDFKFFISNIGLAGESSRENKSMPYPGDQEQVGVYLANFTAPNYDNGHGLNSHKLRFKAPVGNYSDIRYNMQVPSDYNLGAMTTNPYPLNVSNGMYWSWNSGFKFLVINGTSTSLTGFNGVHLSLGADKMCLYNFRSMVLAPSLPKIKVEKDKVTQIKFTFNLMSVFRNTDGTNYSLISTNPNLNNAQVHGGSNSNVLRGNIQQAIELINFTNPN